MNRPANPPIDKRELRRWAAQRRAALGGAWRASAEAAAAQRAIELIESRGAKTVALFTSFGDEIDTHGLIRELLRQNIRVALPRVVRGEKRIELSVIHQFPEDLAAGTYGILEPDPDRHGKSLPPPLAASSSCRGCFSRARAGGSATAAAITTGCSRKSLRP